MSGTTVTLYYREGTSDKVYQASIAPSGVGFVVNFAFGRRGSTLQTGTKTSSPVTLDKAQAIFDKLVREKTAKGYTPGEDGTPYQGTPTESRVTGVNCQLLNPIGEEQLAGYLADSEYLAQEKFDGRRMLVRCQDGKTEGINRKGLVVGLPKAIVVAVEALGHKDLILDGEAMGDVLHIFDILNINGGSQLHESYHKRLVILEILLANQPADSPLSLVETARTKDEKAALVKRLRGEGREGVVFKDANAPYTAGRPASGGSQVKFKFCETASCIVVSQNCARSVALGLFDGNGAVIPCGNVAIPPNHEIPAPDALVEIRYLYAIPQSHALYQPVYLGCREDVERGDCTLNQLKYKAE